MGISRVKADVSNAAQVDGAPKAEADTHPELALEGGGSVPKIFWRDNPTFVVDQVVAFSGGNGVDRITFGELAFDPDPGAHLPLMKTNVTLAMSPAAMRMIAKAFQERVAFVEAGGYGALSSDD